MRAGALDRPIRIETPVETQDEFGQPIVVWQTLASVWANVRSVDAIESYTASRELATTAKRFLFRWVTGLTAKDRIVYEGRNYDIVSIAEREQRGREAWVEVMGEIKQ